MTAYAEGRYQVIKHIEPASAICRDRNLDRTVCIHWVASIDRREAVRSRVAALQSVRSPYVALIYDLVVEQGRVGVVEENLDEVATITSDRDIYDFCAGLAALHDNGLAHGALDKNSFRAGPLGHGRLCNLAFDGGHLDDPSTDLEAFAECLYAMGTERVKDPVFQSLLGRLETSGPPPIQAFRDRLGAFLLRDQHRALAYWRGTSVELGAGKRSARLAHPLPDVASVTLQYDGTRFLLAEVNGEVRVNNVALSAGDDLPSSCVIALGDSHRPASERYFITFDQSHPEVA